MAYGRNEENGVKAILHMLFALCLGHTLYAISSPGRIGEEWYA